MDPVTRQPKQTPLREPAVAVSLVLQSVSRREYRARCRVGIVMPVGVTHTPEPCATESSLLSNSRLCGALPLLAVCYLHGLRNLVPDLVLSCHVMSCLVSSCLALPYLTLPCLALPCLAFFLHLPSLFSRFFFRYILPRSFLIYPPLLLAPLTPSYLLSSNCPNTGKGASRGSQYKLLICTLS